MKARIYKGEWSGNHSQHWLDANKDKLIGGQFVSEWQLTEVLPNNLIKPFWNGSEWIEGAKAEEIAEQELEKQKILKQKQYEELLETDWYVVRFVETGVKIPEEILQQRQDIRNKYK